MSEQPEDADPRPWEEPGHFRRDFEPSAGYLIVTLGLCACVFGVLGVGFLPFGVTGLLVAIGARYVAAHEAERMRVGLIHPDAWKVAERGIDTAGVAFRLNVAVMAYWVLFGLMFWLL